MATTTLIGTDDDLGDIGLRDGTSATFDNYIVKAPARRRDVERRSLLSPETP
ncbi:hypothetical protein [Ilumatobacter sp.]|uniref:hypothetical protein n=1 Tax=Ilumatobacter sp. TaxID=1967498 RepID=UPI003752EFB1